MCSIHNISLKSASDSPVHVKVKIMLFVQLGNLHEQVSFGVVENFTVQLIVWISITDRFVKGTLLMDRCIAPMQSRSVAITSKYMQLLDSLAALKTHSDIESSMND